MGKNLSPQGTQKPMEQYCNLYSSTIAIEISLFKSKLVLFEVHQSTTCEPHVKTPAELPGCNQQIYWVCLLLPFSVTNEKVDCSGTKVEDVQKHIPYLLPFCVTI